MCKFNPDEFQVDVSKYKNEHIESFITYLRSREDIKFAMEGIPALVRYFHVPLRLSSITILVESAGSKKPCITYLNDYLKWLEAQTDDAVSAEVKNVGWFDIVDDGDDCRAYLGEQGDVGYYLSVSIIAVKELPKGYVKRGNECTYSLPTLCNQIAKDGYDCGVCNTFAVAYVIDHYGTAVPKALRDYEFGSEWANFDWQDALCEDFGEFVHDVGVLHVMCQKGKTGEIKTVEDGIAYLKSFQTVLTDWLTELAKRHNYDTVFTYNPDGDCDDWYGGVLEPVFSDEE